jgi:hypothetical protein
MSLHALNLFVDLQETDLYWRYLSRVEVVEG